jgi:hypothetical protein
MLTFEHGVTQDILSPALSVTSFNLTRMIPAVNLLRSGPAVFVSLPELRDIEILYLRLLAGDCEPLDWLGDCGNESQCGKECCALHK